MNERSRNSIPLHLVAALLIVLLAGGGWMLWPENRRPSEAVSADALGGLLPQPRLDGAFITSQGCRECHAEQFASWHTTYHRTMTQPATPENVRADFDDVTLELRGYEFRLIREGNEYWVELPDLDYAHADLSVPLSDLAAPRVKRRIVMTTGSHHAQFIWMAPSTAGGLLRSVPFVYLFDDQRWIPIEDAVLGTAPVAGLNTWNADCIRCHSVGAIPSISPDLSRAETRVAELGISCEACHGPGAAHAERHRSGVAACRAHDQPDPTIVLPNHVDHRVSAQICGQCHSVFTYKGTRQHDLAAGYSYRAGGELTADRYIVQPLARETDPQAREVITEFFQDLAGGERSEFWDDGTPRISGREYNGLLESACYQRGTMSCVSCHSMHDSPPNDQLSAPGDSNQSCYQCHEDYRAKLIEHTHHLADSTGSACYNCHMPHTAYGQYVFSRTHRVDSPSVASDLAGRPNACILCHLDQTLPWVAKHLASWYGQAEPVLDEAQTSVSAAVMYALRGDACQRALIAWHARWEPARAVSGTSWLAPTIAQLLTDPYAAVRYQAMRSLKTLPGFEKLIYDYIAPADVRVARQKQAFQLWEQQGAAATDRRGAQWLLNADGTLMINRAQQLLEKRDDRPLRCVN